ncbi:MAG: hypothetical protein ABSG03_09015 [Bryobacteraceae bacterium]|jgi:hypothetical protein
MRDIRLGDDIDDFCVRCKRVTNHVVVSVVKAAPAKVRCRTCHSDHDFRNEQAPPPKVDLRKQALFNEVLKKVDPAEAALGAQDLAAQDLDAQDLNAEVLAADPVEIEVEDVAIEAVAGVEEEPPKPAPKAKAKTKTKARK